MSNAVIWIAPATTDRPARLPRTSQKLRALAKKKRNELTRAERALWKHLRSSRGSVRFRAQWAVGRRRPDFVCISAGVVLEVDGGEHNEEENAAWTAHLHEHGFTVARVTNEQALAFGKRIADAIFEFAETQLPVQLEKKRRHPFRRRNSTMRKRRVPGEQAQSSRPSGVRKREP